MSRLAKKPIVIPENARVEIKDGSIFVKGPKGELVRNFRNELIDVSIAEGGVYVKAVKDNLQSKMLLGTTVSHIKNMIEGTMNGFKKKLIIEGIGYKAEARGEDLILSLGFSHPVNFKIPSDISVTVEKNAINVSGIDKERVGLISSKIRLLKKPEPYKGKGIRYENEIIKKKAGKRVGGTTT